MCRCAVCRTGKEVDRCAGVQCVEQVRRWTGVQVCSV